MAIIADKNVSDAHIIRKLKRIGKSPSYIRGYLRGWNQVKNSK